MLTNRLGIETPRARSYLLNLKDAKLNLNEAKLNLKEAKLYVNEA